MQQRLARRGAYALTWAAATLTAHAQGTSLVAGQLIERDTDQADYARDLMAGARMTPGAINQSGGIKGRRISLIRREVALGGAIL